MVTTSSPPDVGLPRRNRSHRAIWSAIGIVLLASLGWFVARPLLSNGSGDPGGKVMAQLIPAASALPGYGTSALPWTSEPSLTHGYLVQMEPQQDSCDGRAGTQGWSSVVVQGGFTWSGPAPSLSTRVGTNLARLGWQPDGGSVSGPWTKRLSNGSTATATLDPQPLTDAWEFVVQAPPVGTSASGC